MFVSDLHPSNIFGSITLTDGGIVISFNDKQPTKAFVLIDTIESASSIEDKLMHPSKMLDSIILTDGGIDIVNNATHPSNVLDPIDVTDEGIVIFLK